MRKPLDRLRSVMFRYTHRVQTNEGAYRIPSLEMALAEKYSAIVSPYRRGMLKYRDKYEFALLIDRHPDFECQRLRKLADFVCVGGGKSIMRDIRQMRGEDNSVF